MSKFWLKLKHHGCFKILLLILGCLISVGAFAAATATSLGGIAEEITKSFLGIGHLMIAISYIAGIGFAIAAIFKFKQHKDNPTQIPLGTPLALLAIAIALVFLPAFFKPAGKTLGVGTSAAGGFTGAGVTKLPGY